MHDESKRRVLEVDETGIWFRLDTSYGVRAARTLAYGLLAEGFTVASQYIFELVGRD